MGLVVIKERSLVQACFCNCNQHTFRLARELKLIHLYDCNNIGTFFALDLKAIDITPVHILFSFGLHMAVMKILMRRSNWTTARINFKATRCYYFP